MISNTRSKTVKTPGKNNIYMQFFMLVGVSVIDILLFNRKKKQNDIATQIETTSFLKKISPNIISIQHVLHFVVGRSQIEWKLKVKTLVFP